MYLKQVWNDHAAFQFVFILIYPVFPPSLPLWRQYDAWVLKPQLNQ